jgi:hypothetical protein
MREDIVLDTKKAGPTAPTRSAQGRQVRACTMARSRRNWSEPPASLVRTRVLGTTASTARHFLHFWATATRFSFHVKARFFPFSPHVTIVHKRGGKQRLCELATGIEGGRNGALPTRRDDFYTLCIYLAFLLSVDMIKNTWRQRDFVCISLGRFQSHFRRFGRRVLEGRRFSHDGCIWLVGMI